MDVLIVVFGLTVIVVICKVIEFSLRKAYIENITDKYVFITGCDSGFGNKLTKQLDTKGVHVIAACLTETGSQQLNDATSERVKTLLMNVTQHDSIAKAYEDVQKIIPKDTALWGVVNNAGIANLPGYLEWSRREDFEKLCSVNLFGAIDVTLTFLPLLKKSHGRLVMVTSCAGRLPMIPGGYVESKFGLEAFSDIVRIECLKLGYKVRVSILQPGFFSTPMLDRAKGVDDVQQAWNRLSREEKQEFPEETIQKPVTSLDKLKDVFMSTDLSQVTNSMEHALFAQWPKTRYVIGWDARFLWIPLSYLPACVVDAILAHM